VARSRYDAVADARTPWRGRILYSRYTDTVMRAENGGRAEELGANSHVAPAHRWLSEPWKRRRPNVTRVFCFPKAGAGVGAFKTWRKHNFDAVDLTFVRLPARETRFDEDPLHDVASVVRTFCDDVQADLQPPFALFGHCLGAIIGFEICRELRRRRRPQPAILAVADAEAPHWVRDKGRLSDVKPADLVDVLVTEHVLPEAIAADHELLALVLPALMGDLELAGRYTYQAEAPLACDILVFTRGEPSEAVAAWAFQTSGRFDVVCLPDHGDDSSVPALVALNDALRSDT
jgi:surfactin synthase thioesterase subunit